MNYTYFNALLLVINYWARIYDNPQLYQSRFVKLNEMREEPITPYWKQL